MIKSAEEFVRLRSSADPEDYRRAANERASMQVWHEVIQRYPEYRQWVAHNKSIPVEILTQLATDSDWRVRWQVASRRKTPPSVLEQLAGDPDEGVRQRVVRHHRLSVAVLRQLRSDPSAAVRDLAERRLDALNDLDEPTNNADY